MTKRAEIIEICFLAYMASAQELRLSKPGKSQSKCKTFRCLLVLLISTDVSSKASAK